MVGLSIDCVTAGYGNTKVLQNITLDLAPGEVVAVLGANGAGKSTLLKTISGLLPTWSGAICFRGMEITKTPYDRRVQAGLIHVPEGRRIFGDLTVLENLEIGAYLRKDRAEVKRDLEMFLGLFPSLRKRVKEKGKSLSGGEQQMLAIARGLMAKPELLMLDEPSLGLSPILVDEIMGIIEKISMSGTNILLVEQNAALALDIADRGYILELGEIVLAGTARDLWEDVRVREAYLS